MSKPCHLPQVGEQIVLDELQVQGVGPEDHPRFQSLLRWHRYLQGIKPVGERLCFDVTGCLVGIEGGLHQRLDVSADKDRSRVRHRNAAWILGMFRRICVSLLLHWRGQDAKRAKSTLPISTKKWAWNTNAMRSPWSTLKKLILYVVHCKQVTKSQKASDSLATNRVSSMISPQPGGGCSKESRPLEAS